VSRGEVQIKGFGTIKSRTGKAWIGNNPRTGEQIHVAAKTSPVLRPARCAELPVRHPWQDAVESYRARRAHALIDIGERLRMTGLIFNF
jgi:hypothetical protein